MGLHADVSALRVMQGERRGTTRFDENVWASAGEYGLLKEIGRPSQQRWSSAINCLER